MKKSARSKIKAIIFWYRMSARQLSNDQKLRLLKVWKEICVEYEEYEIASALRKERSRLVRALRLKKIGRRSELETIKLKFRIFKRKISRLFS